MHRNGPLPQVICNYRVPRITLSILTAATTDYHNAIDANNMDTLNKIATPNYNCSYSVRSASGNEPLKTTVRISTCHRLLLKPLEATFRMTKMLKPRKLRLLLTRSQ